MAEDDESPETGRWKAPALGVVAGLVATVVVAVGALVGESVLLLILAPPAVGGILAGAIARKGLVLGTLAGFGVGGVFGVAQLALVYNSVTSSATTAGAGLGLALLLMLSLAYVGVATAIGGLGGFVGGAIAEQR